MITLNIGDLFFTARNRGFGREFIWRDVIAVRSIPDHIFQPTFHAMISSFILRRIKANI